MVEEHARCTEARPPREENESGMALVRSPNGEVRRAELHWYEAHGVGRRKMKVKRILD